MTAILMGLTLFLAGEECCVLLRPVRDPRELFQSMVAYRQLRGQNGPISRTDGRYRPMATARVLANDCSRFAREFSPGHKENTV